MEVYLDYNSTSPLDPRVLEAMLPFMRGDFGNASSFHQKGQRARHGIEKAREEIAAYLETEPGDIVFTSGGTESDNLALKGVLFAAPAARNGLVVSAVEHQAVLHCADYLKTLGHPVTVVPVNREGVVDLERLAAAISEQTALVSVMHVNNETGAVQPVSEAARLAHAKGALFHTDAVQSFGKLRLIPEECGADLLSASAHKICGPKGAGILYAKKGLQLKAGLHGGHHEKNVRPGTENVTAAVGFGKAVEIAARESAAESQRVRALRNRLEKAIFQGIHGARLNGPKQERIYNTLNVSFEGLDGETLLMNLDLKNIYVSTGSACTAGSVEPSHVLLALGLEERLARAAIRFSPGRFTTDKEIDYAIVELPLIVERLRKEAAC